MPQFRWFSTSPSLLKRNFGCAIAPGCLRAGAADAKPLKPADRSSPRAALQMFLDSGDAFGEFAEREDLLSPPSHCGA
jgi:hypothetical protein